MFEKILVANRGEIAIRAFRAAVELGARTVAVYPHEDRHSLHRLKADEAYLIGEEGHPVRAYLDVDEIIRVALECGADAIYPGYGFLSENPDLARAAADNGIVFIGPSAGVLEMAGNKVTAKEHATAAGVPVLASTPPSTDVELLLEQAEGIGFPVFAKAVAGGGGRGMRRVERAEDLEDALRAAMREADSAFGDPTMFLEQAVLRPRHIEVQILADATGETVHLFERDCSVQRRHQKVVEIAPAPNLDPAIRDAMRAHAIAFARSIGYVNAGTVEFLLDTDGPRAGQHVFIEMNPRIQVEHTVTEEVTDVDLVQSQMRIAAGETLAELGLGQDAIVLRGAALQCRITTEDPAQGFRPDTGKITTYRSPGGGGIRIDGGTVATGAQISPHFDSMLAKLTCRGRDFPAAVTRAKRALAEFRIRGVSTNIPFLQGVLDDPDFQAGDISTSFIDERPGLVRSNVSKDRGTKILNWLADVTVNQPNGPRTAVVRPVDKLPDVDLRQPAPAGSRQRLLELGPRGFADALRAQTALAVTETTFRDAHQSLLATRVRTRDLVAVAPYVARTTPELLSVEAWGGATYDVALRFLGEDPWERLASLREALPNVAIQMLLRGANTVGYTPYPTEVTDAFVQEAAATGVDVFRIFDALNDVERMRPAIDSVLATGTTVAEVALCYTGNLLDPAEDLYTLDYYLGLAERSVAAGAHVLAIKDMAGLLRPAAAERLVTALRREFDLPVHVHTPTRRAASSRPCSRPAAPGPTRSTSRARPCRAPRASRRRPRSSPPSRTPSATRASRSTRSATSSRTGRRSAACTGRSSPGSRARPGACTGTRSPGGSSRTSASRRSRSASPTTSSSSRTCTPPPTGSSAASPRSRRRPRWSATSPSSSRPRRPTRPTSSATRRTTTSPTRWSASWRASWATCPAAGRSRSAPGSSRDATCASASRPSPPRTAPRCACPASSGGARSTTSCSRSRRSSSRPSASSSATSPCSTPTTTCTASARGRSTRCGSAGASRSSSASRPWVTRTSRGCGPSWSS